MCRLALIKEGVYYLKKYLQLTKKEQDKIICKFDDTDECRLHRHNCKTCPIMRYILMQLNAFEETYIDAEE